MKKSFDFYTNIGEHKARAMTVLKFICTIVLAIVVLVFFYILPYFSPGEKAEYDDSFVNPDKESSELLMESETLENEFEKEAMVGGVTKETLEKLRKAIALQEIYIEKSRVRDRTPVARLLKLKTRFQNIQAAPLADLVSDLERRAKADFEAKRYESARALYQKAYDIQSTINSDYSLSDYKDIRKSFMYSHEAKMIMALPIYTESLEAENSAKKALDSGDWRTAQNEFERAINLVSQMNAQFPSSHYSDYARLQRLEMEFASLKSAGINENKQKYVKKAESALGNKDYLLASEAYGDALELQKEINKTFPKSRYASEKLAEELERKRSEAFSWKFGIEILDQEKVLNSALRESRVDDVSKISQNLLRKAEQFKQDFPKSDMIGDNLVLRLRYIDFVVKHISEIQNLVNSNLVLLEGIKGKKFLNTEVTQKLFTLVMLENPSRHSDNPLNPVESVTLDDVVKFNVRLSWILGKKVNLPTEKEFLECLGSLRYVDINEISWNNYNSGGMTKPVASKKCNDRGFYDLVGNVAEFVLSDGNSGDFKTYVMGGSAQSSTDEIVRLKKVQVNPKQRNRMVGFRIVVEDGE